MRIAFVQSSPRLGSTAGNLAEAFSLITQVREADLIVLPELFHCGYAVRDIEESKNLAVSSGENSDPLNMVLDACRNFAMNIVAGFLERDDSGKLFNSAWLVGPDGVFAKYRKVHLFDHEKNYFEAGDKPGPITRIGPFKSSPGQSARVGMQICFDWVFPDGWGHLAWADGDYERPTGAQVIAHPVNLVLPGKCPQAIRTRATENRVFIISAGRVGTDPGLDGEIEFKAGSIIVNPDGEILAEGPEFHSGCDMITIDPSLADDKYITSRNHVLRERYGINDSE